MSIDPAKETAMSITINRRTTRELHQRRKEIYNSFKDSGIMREGAQLEQANLRDLVVMGTLSDSERSLYDELVRIESLLNP